MGGVTGSSIEVNIQAKELSRNMRVRPARHVFNRAQTA
jgi:hypothetical protein